MTSLFGPRCAAGAGPIADWMRKRPCASSSGVVVSNASGSQRRPAILHSLTPNPSPSSSMKTTPAFSCARWIAAIERPEAGGRPEPSARLTVATDTPAAVATCVALCRGWPAPLSTAPKRPFRCLGLVFRLPPHIPLTAFIDPAGATKRSRRMHLFGQRLKHEVRAFSPITLGSIMIS
jgi:hypothetical protein